MPLHFITQVNELQLWCPHTFLQTSLHIILSTLMTIALQQLLYFHCCILSSALWLSLAVISLTRARTGGQACIVLRLFIAVLFSPACMHHMGCLSCVDYVFDVMFLLCPHCESISLWDNKVNQPAETFIVLSMYIFLYLLEKTTLNLTFLNLTGSERKLISF